MRRVLHKKTVQLTLERIERHFGRKYGLEFNAAKPRITANNGDRIVSPRFNFAEMLIWLDGFEAGLSEAEVDAARRELVRGMSGEPFGGAA